MSVTDRLRAFIEHPWFNTAIAVVIAINAVTLGLETSQTAMAVAGPVLTALDRIALWIFVAELLMKLFVYRLSFFKGGWNWFDFIIVVISVAPFSGNLSVLRALRILRALRLFSMVPDMRRVVQALVGAVPGMLSVVAVLMLVFYVSAVLATKMFGVHPDPDMQEWFGTVPASMYTLFQIMTLESWSMGIVRPTMELFPYSWMFFLPFIVTTSFAVLNLFIAIIVNAMSSEQHAEMDHQLAEIRKAGHDELEPVLAELRGLRAEVEGLRAELAGRDRPS